MIYSKSALRLLLLFVLTTVLWIMISQQVLSGNKQMQEHEFMIEIENEIFQTAKKERKERGQD